MSDRPRPRAETRTRLPLLDRLLDGGQPLPPGHREPAPPERPPSPAEALQRLHDAVRRDLEALLNARRRRLPPPPELQELSLSPIGYGIPDAAAGTFAIEERRVALAREVELAIQRFEPRLTNITVTLRPPVREFERTLRLRVDAMLRTDPIPEPVGFETVVEAGTLDVAVREV
ncbi:type VI secretion system baseplate subunit TssE [Roseomonas sp. NAR14]|uniref:Type VI secretion system baseplate subunit TssE n=1 Tax=Roseomonas acroporae TaxID=2937791 RepID=A0A9X2BXN4_9PROT|nr:type VI secretion system baseplate subunit TssE [Roseomonas acroporae]MCK8785145.1 type VI secretion system baseplate subunit TssE [Roseomonas acroporae]